mmetsp:Transcript_90953/g.294371  ORF Transcript_90953/g.294371 Transcript_90953/m.294371 type:complete len:567 (-) Transcript_90953:63-1763(-)
MAQAPARARPRHAQAAACGAMGLLGKGKAGKQREAATKDETKEAAAAIEQEALKAGSGAQVEARLHRAPQALEDHYDVTEQVVGRCYHGDLKVVKRKSDGAEYVAKPLKLNNITRDGLEMFEREVEALLKLDHPNVVYLADVYFGAHEIMLVMEYCKGGSLFDMMQQCGKYSEKDAQEALRQMLEALAHAHHHKVVHRNANLLNWLYANSESWQGLKLVGWGLVKDFSGHGYMHEVAGSLGFMAPEVFDGKYTTEADIWSLGVCAFMLLYGYPPFKEKTREKTIEAIKAGAYRTNEKATKRLSGHAVDFVDKLLQVHPGKRLSAKTALEHKFMKHKGEHKDLSAGVAADLLQFQKGSAFKRKCMEVMAESLTTEERDMLQQKFREADTNGSGAISVPEFKKVLQENFKCSDEEAQAAFDAIDENHDDEISYTEFLAAMMAKRIHVNDTLLYETFERFDKENTGTIVIKDLQEILQVSEEEAKKVAKEAGGSDEKITYKEFVAYMKAEGTEAGHSEKASKLVDKLKAEKGHGKTLEKHPEVAEPEPDPVVAEGQGATPEAAQCCAVS